MSLWKFHLDMGARRILDCPGKNDCGGSRRKLLEGRTEKLKEKAEVGRAPGEEVVDPFLRSRRGRRKKSFGRNHKGEFH